MTIFEKTRHLTTLIEYEVYANNITSPEIDLLWELTRETNLTVANPSNMATKLQGQLLRFLSIMLSPKNILEIGTFTGYSAICLAEGLSLNGILHTIDYNPEIEDIAQSFFDKSRFANNIKLHIGNALDIIPTLNENFDLVFIDANKANYLDYYNIVFEKVTKGGFIIADNVLWYGKVLNPDKNGEKETQGIVNFNNFIKSDSRVEQLLLPISDGLLIIRKL